MIYVMSDIHGNGPKFDSVMKQINLQPDDTLYVLGDVIDRYPDGIKILRKLIAMPNVKMLLGNHEHMMLEAIGREYNMKNPREANLSLHNLRLWYNNGGNVTHSSLKHIRKTDRAEIFEYLRSLPLNIDISVNGKAYKLVHAAPVESYKWLRERYASEREFAVWYRLRKYEPLNLNGATLIFGHTPTVYFQDDDILKIWHGDDRIGIDCGAGFPQLTKYGDPDIGRLACLRLDDMKEFYSEIPEEPQKY